jgi:hypothetical protein
MICFLVLHAAPGLAAVWNPGTCRTEDDGSSQGPGDLGVLTTVLTTVSGDVTVHYPSILPGSSCTFSMIIWGNGSSATGGTAYPDYFNQLASHGFVVVAHHTNMTLSGTPLLDAAARMMDENNDPSSVFYQRIEPGYGMMGKSQGAIAASRDVEVDPAAVAAVMIAGSLQGVTKPGLWATGDADFLRNQTLAGYNTAANWRIYAEAAAGVGHQDLNTNIGVVELSTSFMRCFLRGDANTCDYVRCESCQTEPWGVFESSEPLAPTGSGAVPDGGSVPGAPLQLSRNGVELVLSWSRSCVTSDLDYAVYEGLLGDYESHVPAGLQPCTTGSATSVSLVPGSGNRYYLVVPQGAVGEGSYGVDSAGAPRAVSLSACRPQVVQACSP